MKWFEDKEYQEMCEGAEEIQKTWKPQKGDWHVYRDVMCGSPVYCVTEYDLDDYSKRDACKGYDTLQMQYEQFQEILSATKAKISDPVTGWMVWLPSQEDLQEMVIKITTKDSLNQTIFLCKWIGKNTLYANEFNDSMTKLWLAFIMHELYQKEWNPETKKWEKTEE